MVAIAVVDVGMLAVDVVVDAVTAVVVAVVAAIVVVVDELTHDDKTIDVTKRKASDNKIILLFM